MLPAASLVQARGALVAPATEHSTVALKSA
jgi:hypothetical protein